MFNGDPFGPKNTVKKGNKYVDVPIASGVHSEFDNYIIENKHKDISSSLESIAKEKEDKNLPVLVSDIKTVNDAAKAAVTLMQHTSAYANPISIVKEFESLINESKRSRCNRLWTDYGPGIKQAMAEAVVLIAHLWEAAWIKGNGENNISQTSKLTEDELNQLYKEIKKKENGFLNSMNLNEVKNSMRWV